MNKIETLENEKIYNGCLNTFVIARYKEGMDVSKIANVYCERYDCDGLILLDIYNKKEDAIFKMIFYNRDGSNGYMCGNGIRCLMRYAYEEGLVKENIRYNVETFTGINECVITSLSPFVVKVNLGKPSYSPSVIETDTTEEYIDHDFLIDNKKIKMSCIFLTTHHAVVMLKSKEELEEIKRQRIGEKLKVHPFFKKGVNVNFVYVIDKDNIFLQTCERGVGWTLACGTGASASFAVLNKMGLVNDKVTAHFVKGCVCVSKNDLGEIYLEGRADKDKKIDL